MRAILLLLLLALAGLWGWALWWPKEPAPLPEQLYGTFDIVNFRLPAESEGSLPFPPGQQRRWTFREDGTYLLAVDVSGGHEMLRREGIVTMDGELLRVRQISENRAEAPNDERFEMEWGLDEQGRSILLLRNIEERYELYLRRAP